MGTEPLKTEELKLFITNIYKQLFGGEPDLVIQLVENFWRDRWRLGHEDNIWLTRLFTMTELEEAMREMKTNTALGPDGFFTSFYKNFRGQVRGVILEMLQLLQGAV